MIVMMKGKPEQFSLPCGTITQLYTLLLCPLSLLKTSDARFTSI